MAKESKIPQDWFKKGDADIKTVDLLLKHGGDLEVASMHIQQAGEKYLKGYLISRNWALKKTHDLVELLDQAMEHDEEFEEFRDLCAEYTALYFQARYPLFGEAPGKEEVGEALIKIKKLIELIKEKTQ